MVRNQKYKKTSLWRASYFRKPLKKRHVLEELLQVAQSFLEMGNIPGVLLIGDCCNATRPIWSNE